jgi:hypothetical protein
MDQIIPRGQLGGHLLHGRAPHTDMVSTGYVEGTFEWLDQFCNCNMKLTGS